MDNVIQIRISDELKNRLERISRRMEVPVSTLIRMVLASFSRSPDAVHITPNGFTHDEEERIIHSAKVTKRAITLGKDEQYSTIDDALTALERETVK
jgi:hypothetical protein